MAFSKFETELTVRPDDIDLYQHVHSTRYLDYVLAARYEQMGRCYGMSMEEFGRRGYGWFMKSAQMNFRRPLVMGDRMLVRCWIETFYEDGVRLQFEIEKISTKKRVFDGYCDYTLVNLATGRAQLIDEDIKQKYSI